ncbi:unnamed protein product [Lactuca saligna]|uniref:MYND-type domain-containing protein n=1 Tax=Lactuca saligna TaxID=75948 RepID=A0AA35YJK7_LACSI|nr:unnamed protein product [Lactuca saligna]
MRTRSGNLYPVEDNNNISGRKRKGRDLTGARKMNCRKRGKPSSGGVDNFDRLPDELVLSILTFVGSRADCPADFLAVLATCKRFRGLGYDSSVLSKASAETFGVTAKNWSESAHRFLKRCSDAGNVEACYTLGMIRFYCFQNWQNGASLMAKAAMSSHAPALYSLAVIHFNGSGGSKSKKDLGGGVSLCARAAFLGHIDALRELGHCLQDGYGVTQNITEGRRFLVQANARELAVARSTIPSALLPGDWLKLNPVLIRRGNTLIPGCPLLSDFGCNVTPEYHPANRFLASWFANRIPSPELLICSHAGCGRPETRMQEFRRCAACGVVNYCSRACQAQDWKMRHHKECRQLMRFHNVIAGGGNVNHNRVENNVGQR